MRLHQLERLGRARLLSFFSLCISGLLASNIMAQQATFSDNVLNIPKATVGQKAYSLDLGLSVSGASYDFGLLAACLIPLLQLPSVDVQHRIWIALNYSK